MGHHNELVDLELSDVHETEQAYLVMDKYGTKAWLPKSQVEREEISNGQRSVYTIPVWLQEEKELEGF